MPGETKETGTVRALKLGDYQDKYPEYHVVVVSKSTKATASTDQVAEYQMNGYVVLEETAHPDLVVVGKPREGEDSFSSWDKQREEELSLANGFGVTREEKDPQTLGELMRNAGMRTNEQ